MKSSSFQKYIVCYGYCEDIHLAKNQDFPYFLQNSQYVSTLRKYRIMIRKEEIPLTSNHFVGKN